MEQQIGVEAFIQPALCKEETDVPLKFFAALEGKTELFHQFGFFFGQVIGMFFVNGGEGAVFQLVLLAINNNGAFFIVDFIQKQAFLHVVLGIAQDWLQALCPCAGS